MDRAEIAAAAEAIVPFVRDCVTEAFSKTVLPPELAGQVASAVRLLHESPVLAQARIEHSNQPPPPPARVTRIERDKDGNFVPVYEPALARAGETQP